MVNLIWLRNDQERIGKQNRARKKSRDVCSGTLGCVCGSIVFMPAQLRTACVQLSDWNLVNGKLNGDFVTPVQLHHQSKQFNSVSYAFYMPFCNLFFFFSVQANVFL